MAYIVAERMKGGYDRPPSEAQPGMCQLITVARRMVTVTAAASCPRGALHSLQQALMHNEHRLPAMHTDRPRRHVACRLPVITTAQFIYILKVGRRTCTSLTCLDLVVISDWSNTGNKSNDISIALWRHSTSRTCSAHTVLNQNYLVDSGSL